jgi:hypothetical protein
MLEKMRRLIACGVDGIHTDKPAELLALRTCHHDHPPRCDQSHDHIPPAACVPALLFPHGDDKA